MVDTSCFSGAGWNQDHEYMNAWDDGCCAVCGEDVMEILAEREKEWLRSRGLKR